MEEAVVVPWLSFVPQREPGWSPHWLVSARYTI